MEEDSKQRWIPKITPNSLYFELLLTMNLRWTVLVVVSLCAGAAVGEVSDMIHRWANCSCNLWSPNRDCLITLGKMQLERVVTVFFLETATANKLVEWWSLWRACMVARHGKMAWGNNRGGRRGRKGKRLSGQKWRLSLLLSHPGTLQVRAYPRQWSRNDH